MLKKCLYLYVIVIILTHTFVIAVKVIMKKCEIVKILFFVPFVAMIIDKHLKNVKPRKNRLFFCS